MPPIRPRRWLHAWLAACMAFVALQGVLGAWLVPRIAGAEVVQVCTAQGMRWVVVSDASGEPNDLAPEGTAALGQPCVWVGVSGAPERVAGTPWQRLLPAQATPLPDWRIWQPPGNPRRVLLMSAMRAPPSNVA
ncbi:hypothetical protein [Hydrogenophaga sp.]|uniref:hypothetical protein n=1 Tax=Hydrogenophaga sp. TaxID=1904254 RepID=UPI0026186AF6|nr:hypothetical protein [Hydrogenophaga sp.]MCW5653120.1 hypothetical protein [Hydrogenophaga sp.]